MKTFGFQWHLTNRCNMRCTHCYAEEFDSRSDMSLSGLQSLADELFTCLARHEVSVNLTGGEPLLLEYLPELARYLQGFENLSRIDMISNGTICNSVLDELGSLENYGCTKVSCESGITSTNDAIRGEGNLASLCVNIPRIAERTKKPVVLMTTLAAYNATDVRATVEMAGRVGASGVIFERFVPLGQGSEIADQTLSAEQWKGAVADITGCAGREIDPVELAGYHAFWLHIDGREENLSGARCNLGDESMALMPDGTVYPCRRLPEEVGNLARGSFEPILDRLAGYAPSALRPRLRGEVCSACGVEDCAGCRALARAVSGDFLADDPACVKILC